MFIHSKGVQKSILCLFDNFRDNLLKAENVSTDAQLLSDISQLHLALMDPVNSNVKLETLKTLGPTANLIKHVKKNNFLNKKADDIVTMNRYIIKKTNVKKPVTLRLKTTTNIIYNRINKAGSASIL